MKASLRAGLFVTTLSASGLAQATLGTIASNFGLLPQDTATAQALSMFSNQPSAVYYNPAYLARDRKGAMSAGFLFTEQDLRAPGWGRPDKVVVDEVINDRSNYNVTLGFKTDLSKMLKDDRAIVLGFMLGSERTGTNLLAFNSSTSTGAAQSLRYGQQSLFLSLGAGLNLARGIDVGAASRITLAASAKLDAVADFNGKTSYETLQVGAKPSIQPIASINFNIGEMFCPDNKYCWAKGLEVAGSWRHESAYSAGVNASAAVQSSGGAVLPLLINTIDAYQPEAFSGGVQYNMYKLRLGASAELQRWSRLNRLLRENTMLDQSGLVFRDVVIPRAGFEYRIDKEISILGGVSYEQSPLKSEQSLNVNYVDNDRIVMGLGMSYLIEQALFLSQPVRLDFGYQYHLLRDRDFLLVTDKGFSGTASPGCPAGTRCENVTSQGRIHALNAALHLTF